MNRKSFASPLLLTAALACLFAGCAQNTPEAVFNRGVRALEDGDIIGASLYFEEFINKFPEDERLLKAYELLANCHMLIKDYGNARAVFQEVKEKFGDDPGIAFSCDFQIGRTYSEEGNFSKAAEKFNEIASATDNANIQYDAHRNLAYIYARQSQPAPAETEEATPAETQPATAKPEFASAIHHFDQMVQIANEKVEDPTQSFYMELEALVGNPQSRAMGKADVYKSHGEFEEARGVYLAAIDAINGATGIAGLDFERQNTRFRWAHTWAEAQDYISAATTYDRLYDSDEILPDWKPQLITWKIQSLERLLRGDGEADYTPEETAVLVRENQRLSENYPETQQGIQAMVAIASLVKDSTPEMSEEYLNKAVQAFEKEISDPSSPRGPMNAMFGIADAYIRLGKLDEAEQALERVKKSYSNVQEAMRQADAMLNYVRNQRQQAEAAAENTETNPPAEP